MSNSQKNPPVDFTFKETSWLTTMGPGSLGADKCDEFYLQKGEFITTLKLYHTPGLGIIGTLFVTNKDRYKVFGSITGSDKTY